MTERESDQVVKKRRKVNGILFTTSFMGGDTKTIRRHV